MPKGEGVLAEGQADRAAVVLGEALELWRGPALADFVDERFAQGDRVRLEELKASALELRLEAELALGRHDLVATEVEALIAEHPLRERLPRAADAGPVPLGSPGRRAPRLPNRANGPG